MTSGDAAGRVVEIDGEIAFGRKGDGPAKLPGDIEISRLHARVWSDAGGDLMVEDAGSTNGTFVNGVRITTPRPLSPGDSLRMGQTTLEVEAPAPAEAAPEAEPAPATPAEPPAPPAEPPAPPAEPPAPPAEPPAPGAEPPPVPAPDAGGTEPVAAGVPRPLVYVLLGVLLLAALGIAAVLYFKPDDEGDTRVDPDAAGPPALVRAAAEAGCVSRDLPPEGDRTVPADTEVRYRSSPPHSGDHAEKPASDGIWETAPPLPKVVGSLQRGRVVMWHKPGDEKGQRLLREVGDQSPKHMLLVPNADMPHRVAATAWGHLLGCPGINGSTAGAVRAFRDAYRDKGPRFDP